MIDSPMASGTDPKMSSRFPSVAPKTVRTKINEIEASMKNPMRGLTFGCNEVTPRPKSLGVSASRIAAPSWNEKPPLVCRHLFAARSSTVIGPIQVQGNEQLLN